MPNVDIRKDSAGREGLYFGDIKVAKWNPKKRILDFIVELLNFGEPISSTTVVEETVEGTTGGGSFSGSYNDLTDVPAEFDPSDHATTHQNGGGDEISVAGLSGVLADPQTPITENVQDIVGAMVVAGTNITATYDDGAGTVTIAQTTSFDTNIDRIVADETYAITVDESFNVPLSE